MTMNKDKGLKQALLQEQPMRLSSNFYYRVMQEVEKASVMQERKAKRRMLFLLICVSLALVAGGIAVLLHYCPGAFVGGVEYAVENAATCLSCPCWHWRCWYCFCCFWITGCGCYIPNVMPISVDMLSILP